jgi:hypothetical protein
MKPGIGDLVVPFPPSTLGGLTTRPMTSAMSWTVNGLGGAVGSGRNLFPLSFESQIRLGSMSATLCGGTERVNCAGVQIRYREGTNDFSKVLE